MKNLVKNELRREVATWLKITSILVGIILLGLSTIFLGISSSSVAEPSLLVIAGPTIKANSLAASISGTPTNHDTNRVEIVS